MKTLAVVFYQHLEVLQQILIYNTLAQSLLSVLIQLFNSVTIHYIQILSES